MFEPGKTLGTLSPSEPYFCGSAAAKPAKRLMATIFISAEFNERADESPNKALNERHELGRMKVEVQLSWKTKKKDIRFET